MTAERLQEGLEWSWRQSYGWRSLLNRVGGAPWSILPLWLSLNFGYRYYAEHLHEKVNGVYRDPPVRSAGNGMLAPVAGTSDG
jgi:hypothetical protein